MIRRQRVLELDRLRCLASRANGDRFRRFTSKRKPENLPNLTIHNSASSTRSGPLDSIPEQVTIVCFVGVSEGLQMKFALPVLVMFLMTIFAFGQAQERVLYSFGGVPDDGISPVSSLISDNAGNLYGTTNYGGTNNAGVAFELSPQSGGTWSESILYNFCSEVNCADGEFPVAGLVMDAAGNLYGTTLYGGTQSGCQAGFSGCGITFELSPQIDGTWAETVLYNFCSVFDNNTCEDGSAPDSQLVFDAAGNLYGTSLGATGGVVFELSPGSNGWTESVLYRFCPNGGNFCADGSIPKGGVAFDKSGNLYGTTQHGGRYRIGVVFELSPNGGSWNERVLTSFYLYGSSVSPVSFDAVGNLYGTTLGSGFQLNARHHSMGMRLFSLETGANSQGGVLIDVARNTLFGTAATLGVNAGGTVWEVNPARELVPIYNFCTLTNCTDGAGPEASVIEDAAGNLYGTTIGGGAYGNGAVFQVTP